MPGAVDLLWRRGSGPVTRGASISHHNGCCHIRRKRRVSTDRQIKWPTRSIRTTLRDADIDAPNSLIHPLGSRSTERKSRFLQHWSKACTPEPSCVPDSLLLTPAILFLKREELRYLKISAKGVRQLNVPRRATTPSDADLLMPEPYWTANLSSSFTIGNESRSHRLSSFLLLVLREEEASNL
jgi:hypothetical protein